MKNPTTEKISVAVDHREETSGIPDLLRVANIDLTLTQLKAGDYVINDRILLERKSASDFIQSAYFRAIILAVFTPGKVRTPAPFID